MALLAGPILLPAAAQAQMPGPAPAWFPLEVGNSWLYRPARTAAGRPLSPDYRSITVHGTEKIDGRDYFDVTWFGREVTLRLEPTDGSIAIYDHAAKLDKLWLSPNRPPGSSYPTEINPCPTQATIVARDANVTTPAGQFANALQVGYHANCADVGATQQYYAADIGLVRDEETSFAGPLVYELAYYRVGTRTAGAPEVSFTLALDAPQVLAGSTLGARLTLRSTSAIPIHLHFPSGQSYELKILDAKGNVVYQWSKGRAFTLIIRDETFGPGEQTYGVAAPLDTLPPGHYTAQACLTTDPILFQAEAGFDIVVAGNALAGVVKTGGRGVLRK
jgi:hypothetical protein